MKVLSKVVIMAALFTVFSVGSVLSEEISETNTPYMLLADNSKDSSNKEEKSAKEERSIIDEISDKIRKEINKHRQPEEKPRTAPAGTRG